MSEHDPDSLDIHLHNIVSEAMTLAMEQGLPPSDAIEVTLAVAADLARGLYGADYLQVIARKVIDRGGMPFR